MSNSLSYKKLRFVSMIMSLFLGLKEDLGLNLSVAKDWPLFLKFRISSSFLPYSANSVFSFTGSTLVAAFIYNTCNFYDGFVWNPSKVQTSPVEQIACFL